MLWRIYLVSLLMLVTYIRHSPSKEISKIALRRDVLCQFALIITYSTTLFFRKNCEKRHSLVHKCIISNPRLRHVLSSAMCITTHSKWFVFLIFFFQNENTFCPVCGESWVQSKPEEIWVECQLCKIWAHDACTARETEMYICDDCTVKVWRLSRRCHYVD